MSKARRGQSNYWPSLSIANISQVRNLRVQKSFIRAISKKNASQVDARDGSNEESTDTATKKPRQATRRRRKKVISDSPDENSLPIDSVKEEDISITATSTEEPKKVTRRGRKKATSPTSKEESIQVKVPKRRTRKKTDTTKAQSTIAEFIDLEEPTTSTPPEEELQLGEDEGEDISFTYSWPPLVCCFGAAQHAFVPSRRPSNRLIDHEIHELKKDMFWSPPKFVRAPGRSSSSVAVALANIGGKVAFMGKVGDDEYGQNIVYYLNVNNVQTRSMVTDSSKPTAVSQMKITRRGGLRMSCIKPCVEDSFLVSEINIDVLKESKMFYFNSFSLLDQNMRSTTMQAIRASKKLGGVIFFDLNLPLPLWNSSEETKLSIQQAWNSADIIEVTKQELKFLLGIEPMEKFDTKDNDKSKFLHHKPEVIKPLWHENLKVLFVTNGASKVHYYTEKDNGWLRGMEDAPITPFTGDMSVSGDAMVAALMRMLTVQPDLITDKGYLEHSIKYAINCGVTDRWILAVSLPLQNTVHESSSRREYRTVEQPVEEPAG